MEAYIFCVLMGMYFCVILLLAGGCLYWMYEIFVVRRKRKRPLTDKERNDLVYDLDHALRYARELVKLLKEGK